MSQPAVIVTTVLLLLFAALMLYFMAQIKAGHMPALRRIRAFEMLQGLSSRAIEAGRPLHLSMGTGDITGPTTSDTLAGLAILEYLAERAAATGINPAVSTADPAVMILAQNRLRAAHGANIQAAQAAYRDVRWLAPQPGAYAAGVMSLLGVDNVESNIMVGSFGDEYLLMGETAAQRHISQVAGASAPNTLPFIYATTQESLLGEEIYAAGAYLQKKPSHFGSLLAQDTMRWVITLAVLAGVLLTSLGISW